MGPFSLLLPVSSASCFKPHRIPISERPRKRIKTERSFIRNLSDWHAVVSPCFSLLAKPFVSFEKSRKTQVPSAKKLWRYDAFMHVSTRSPLLLPTPFTLLYPREISFFFLPFQYSFGFFLSFCAKQCHRLTDPVYVFCRLHVVSGLNRVGENHDFTFGHSRTSSAHVPSRSACFCRNMTYSKNKLIFKLLRVSLAEKIQNWEVIKLQLKLHSNFKFQVTSFFYPLFWKRQIFRFET